MKNINEIRKMAQKVADNDGYIQVIIRDKDGDYSFSRKYNGCCPDWYGEIVEEIKPSK